VTTARPALAAFALSLQAGAASAAGVSVCFDPADPSGAPFPSNRFTVFDGTQNTLRRVALTLSVAIVGSRDGLRQTVIEDLPLVRQIEAGVDVDGDGARPEPAALVLRAGGLADRVANFRNDLGHGLNSGVGKNPQVCLTNLGNPAAAGTAIQGQSQIGAFFASHGARVADPDGPDTYAEVPLSGLLPERLNFIP
jgi:hypothetical protein